MTSIVSRISRAAQGRPRAGAASLRRAAAPSACVILALLVSGCTGRDGLSFGSSDRAPSTASRLVTVPTPRERPGLAPRVAAIPRSAPILLSGALGERILAEPAPLEPGTMRAAMALAPEHSAAHDDGGIGGTGVFGSITALGSIHVNGMQIEVDPAVSGSLAVGDIVSVAIVRNGSRLFAAEVEELHALVGPLTATPSILAEYELYVMGVRVALASGAVVADASGRPAQTTDFTLGDRLAVSGFWHDGEVVATRVEFLADGSGDRVAGELSHGADGWRLGPIPLDGVVEGPGADGFARARGRFDLASGRLQVDSLSTRMPIGLERRGAQLSIEGFVSAQLAQGRATFRIDGLGMALDPQAAPNRIAGGRAILIGESEADAPGVLRAQHGVPLPDDPTRRAAVLAAMVDGFRPIAGAEPLR